MKYTLNDIYKKLEKIITDKESRPKEIKFFQTLIWENDLSFCNEVDECLSDLAQDLDYYEKSDKIRKEDSSYYGETRLIQEIQSSLKIIKKHL